MAETRHVTPAQLEAALGRLSRSLTETGMRDVLQAMGFILHSRSMTSFERETAPQHADGMAGEGRPWAPLSAMTLLQRRQGTGSVQILVDTGTLRQRVVIETRPGEVEVGTAIFYGLYHQTGTGRNLPSRPFVGYNDEDMDKGRTLIMETIQEALR